MRVPVRQTHPVYPTKQGERVRVLVRQIDPVYPINEGARVRVLVRREWSLFWFVSSGMLASIAMEVCVGYHVA